MKRAEETEVEIRPFHIDVAEDALASLRRRVAATQWPETETVSDESQGVPLATMQRLARYWETEYDWRKVEAKLNALPQFITEIDGLDIHFIHVRSPWTEEAYPNLIYFNEVDKGGHFAAWEQPQLFSEELRAAFSSLR